MNRNEFEQRTGLRVSHTFYTEEVEPLYMNGQLTKDEFCADWLKANRKSVVKTIERDFDRLAMDRTYLDGARKDKEQALIAAANRAQELAGADKYIAELEQTLSKTQDEVLSVNAKWEAAECAKMDIREELGAYKAIASEQSEKIAKQNNEIKKLKARLYDMITAAAGAGA